MKKILLLILLSLIFGCANTSSKITTYVFEIRPTQKPIVVDGVLSDTEWSHAQINMIPALVYREKGGRDYETTLSVLYDEKGLYFGIKCVDDQVYLESEAELEGRSLSDKLARNDSCSLSVEIGGPSSKRFRGYRFSMLAGKLLSARVYGSSLGPKSSAVDLSKPLKSELYKIGFSQQERLWSVELALTWMAYDRILLPLEPFSVRLRRDDTDNGIHLNCSEGPGVVGRRLVFKFVD